MGLLDVLNGMQNGPRGPSTPSAQSERRRHVADDHGDPGAARLEGASSISAAASPARRRAGASELPGNVTAGLPGGGAGGGLGDLLKGGLGGLLAGGAAGSILSGGLGDLLNQFQQKGHGDTANSWVGNGPNKPIAPGDLANALGADQIEQLSVAERPVARRIAARPQPVSARRRSII